MSCEEKTAELAFEVGRENFLAGGCTDFVKGPKPPAVKFLRRRTYLSVVYRAVDIHQFALPLAFKHILAYADRSEVFDAKLLTHLATQGI